MKVATFEGFVENGHVRLPAAVRLPEKARVFVVVPEAEMPSPSYVGSPRLARPEQAGDFEKVVEDVNGGL